MDESGLVSHPHRVLKDGLEVSPHPIPDVRHHQRKKFLLNSFIEPNPISVAARRVGDWDALLLQFSHRDVMKLAQKRRQLVGEAILNVLALPEDFVTVERNPGDQSVCREIVVTSFHIRHSHVHMLPHQAENPGLRNQRFPGPLVLRKTKHPLMVDDQNIVHEPLGIRLYR